MNLRKEHLFFTEGSSDKEYLLYLVQQGEDTYSVLTKHGPRGRAHSSGVSLSKVPLVEARKEFDRILRSKMKKGYTRDGSGIPFKKCALDAERESEILRALIPNQDESPASAPTPPKKKTRL